MGAPSGSADEGIREEHCERPDANDIFITGNYQVHTSSKMECASMPPPLRPSWAENPIATAIARGSDWFVVDPLEEGKEQEDKLFADGSSTASEPRGLAPSSGSSPMPRGGP